MKWWQCLEFALLGFSLVCFVWALISLHRARKSLKAVKKQLDDLSFALDISTGNLQDLEPGTFEMWTVDKKKITIAVLADGGLCVSCGKTEDPDYPI